MEDREPARRSILSPGPPWRIWGRTKKMLLYFTVLLIYLFSMHTCINYIYILPRFYLYFLRVQGLSRKRDIALAPAEPAAPGARGTGGPTGPGGAWEDAACDCWDSSAPAAAPGTPRQSPMTQKRPYTGPRALQQASQKEKRILQP